MFQNDPFSSKSPSPMLKTKSSPIQIREARERMSSETWSSGGSKTSTGQSKKFHFDNTLRASSDSDPTDPLSLILGGSPLPKTRAAAKARSSMIPVSSEQEPEPRASTSTEPGIASGDNALSKPSSFKSALCNVSTPPATHPRAASTPVAIRGSLFDENGDPKRSKGFANLFRLGDKPRASTMVDQASSKEETDAQRQAEVSDTSEKQLRLPLY